MREERLLERIRLRKKEPGRRERGDPKRTIDSVLRHLQRILNTKRGNVEIAPDYGMPDFTALLRNYPDSLRDMERSINLTIQKYEPRLKDVRVSFIPQEEDAFSLKFQIAARLVTENETVYFESQVDSDGKISIR